MREKDTVEKSFLAIDIGSNAMRAIYAVLDKRNDLEILENYRFALRLGGDVFKNQKLSDEKFWATEEAFRKINKLIKEKNIHNVKAMATSALRNAKNGLKLVDKIEEKFDLKIQIIDGDTEAKIISKAVSSRLKLKDQLAMLIDIGGGSTEITLLDSGKIVYSKSFPTGTLRLLQLESLDEVKKAAKKFSENLYKDLKELSLDDKIKLCVGTGGNLRRMGKLRKTFFKRSNLKIFQSELIAINSEVKKLSIQQRMNFLSMREDRADVIVPAMCLIEDLLIKFDIPEILLPQVGLKEGILLDMIKGTPRYTYNY